MKTPRRCKLCETTKSARFFKGASRACIECQSLELPDVEYVERICLKCDKPFPSSNMGNRRCDACKASVESQYALLWSSDARDT